MAFQSVPETAEIDMIFTHLGVTVQNTHYARKPGGYNLADLQTLADNVDDAFAATFVTDVTAATVYVRTEVRGLEFENDQVAENGDGTGPGTHIGDPLPGQVTLAIKKTSGLTGRSARGRSFWIGTPADELDEADENLVKSTYGEVARADIDFIRATINAVLTWEAVLVSRFADGLKRDDGVTFPWLATALNDLRLDTHRGRLPSP